MNIDMRPIAALLIPVVLFASGSALGGTLSPRALTAAQQQGKVRVLVTLHEQAPDLRRENAPQRQRQVAEKVDRMLARLPARGHSLVRRFANVQAVAIEADATTLERLRDDPAVDRIDLDLPGSGGGMAPDESSVLNNVSPLAQRGFGGAGMKVAVIDSGLDTSHPDLASRLIGQQCFCSNTAGSAGCCPNGQATQAGPGAAEDDHGHGTNVSGIVIGKGDMSPVGAVPGSQLVAVKVLDRSNNFCCSSDIVAALDWVATNHPDVDAVNLSLGTNSVFEGNCDNATSFTQAMATAVAALVARGAVVVSSTGNDGNSNATQAPSCLASVMSVGATWDFTGGARTFLGCTETATAPRMPACFSNRGSTTDVYAAGAFVRSAGLSGGISTFGGTSQAAPMVTACAVALKQAAPVSSVEQRMEAMRLAPSNVTDAVSGRQYPFLDCMAALNLLSPARVTHDFDGDGNSDILWRNLATGANAIWRSAIVKQNIARVPGQTWSIAGVGDFDGDGRSDILWRNASTGSSTIWKSGNSATTQALTRITNLSWQVAGVGDLDGDGMSDIFWRNQATGANAIWRSGNFGTQLATTNVANLDWKAVGFGDFDGDGKDDVLWRNSSSGVNTIWSSGNASTRQPVAQVSNQAWRVSGVGDVDGDGKSDIVWRNASTGANSVWPSGTAASAQPMASVTNTAWRIVAMGDYNGDARSDVLWRNATTGANAIWRSGNAATPQAVTGVSDLAWVAQP